MRQKIRNSKMGRDFSKVALLAGSLAVTSCATCPKASKDVAAQNPQVSVPNTADVPKPETKTSAYCNSESSSVLSKESAYGVDVVYKKEIRRVQVNSTIEYDDLDGNFITVGQVGKIDDQGILLYDVSGYSDNVLFETLEYGKKVQVGEFLSTFSITALGPCQNETGVVQDNKAVVSIEYPTSVTKSSLLQGIRYGADDTITDELNAGVPLRINNNFLLMRFKEKKGGIQVGVGPVHEKGADLFMYAYLTGDNKPGESFQDSVRKITELPGKTCHVEFGKAVSLDPLDITVMAKKGPLPGTVYLEVVSKDLAGECKPVKE